MRIVFLLLILILAGSCERKPRFRIEEISIVAQEPEKIALWYVTNFGFQDLKNHQEVIYQDFRIIFRKNENAIHSERLKEAFHLQELPGFNKFGFLTNYFDDMVARLKKNNVTIVGKVMKDENIGRRTLVVKDPEGNLVQIFEDNGSERLKPYFISVVAASIGELEKWYQVKMPIEKSYNMDLPDQKIYMRILAGENILIELINTSERPVKTGINRENILGFESVKVSGLSAQFEHDPEGNLIRNIR